MKIPVKQLRKGFYSYGVNNIKTTKYLVMNVYKSTFLAQHFKKFKLYLFLQGEILYLCQL